MNLRYLMSGFAAITMLLVIGESVARMGTPTRPYVGRTTQLTTERSVHELRNPAMD